MAVLVRHDTPSGSSAVSSGTMLRRTWPRRSSAYLLSARFGSRSPGWAAGWVSARAFPAGHFRPRPTDRPSSSARDFHFPNRWGNPVKDSFLSQLLKELEIAAVPHGFPSSFRDWAAEETDHPREVIEAALAHVVQNKVEAAYARSDLFERRRRLMDDWEAYLDGQHRAENSLRR